ncbi:hypothetical protein [Sphingobium subterraneum]|uniref:Uncharacterized protein n=1 Tax=Sphingobium subterraneum TaxID=627688 RepID=A0A841J9E0_9SPHN|nr:hypothetical protein [Sphingobium subterraneum]MBB6125168.1 hypothetical protein [Sphingobium subterraneum]
MTNAKTTETKDFSPVSNDPVATTIVTLNDLCAELKLDRREARLVLRMAAKDTKTFPYLAATHVARQPWQWDITSAAYEDARKALSNPLPA